MQRTIYRTCSLILLAIAPGCSDDPTHQPPLVVGDEPPAHEPTGPGAPAPAHVGMAAPVRSDAGQPGDLALTFRDATGAALTRLALACGECAEIEAVASGGTPPYQLVWDDQSTEARRRLCPASSSTVSVSVSDTAVAAEEFGHPSATRRESLSVEVGSCTTPITKPAAGCHPDEGPRCDLGGGKLLPEDLTVDVPGATVRYFAQGSSLPKGRYRIAYVDGCNTYGVLIGWSVHAASGQPGISSVSLIGEDGQPFLVAPGTELYPPSGDGEAKTYAECVAFNCKLAPIDFDHSGGKLGVLRDGGGTLGAIDDATGESAGGRSPTFRLIRLDPCSNAMR